jgi:hypothetical protein
MSRGCLGSPAGLDEGQRSARQSRNATGGKKREREGSWRQEGHELVAEGSSRRDSGGLCAISGEPDGECLLWLRGMNSDCLRDDVQMRLYDSVVD